MANPLTSFAGNLQNVSGKLEKHLEAHGVTVLEFVAWLAKPENEQAIAEMARLPFLPKSLLPPPGGRIHAIAVKVESKSWYEAVSAAGPNTGNDWAIWKVGDQYKLPTPGKAEVTLVNFGKSMESEEVLAYAKANNLKPANPYQVFAIGKDNVNLHRDLGLSYVAVVTLESCSFGGGRRVPCVWWRGAGRSAHLDYFGNGWSGHDWFAFVRE